MRILYWIIALLFVLAPPAVYFTLELIQPRIFALGLMVIFLIRSLSSWKKIDHVVAFAIWLVLMVTALAVIALSNRVTALLLYPVVMNAGFLLLFLYSLLVPPSVIESIARVYDPDLSESGVRYTRKVTMVWCVFFIVNGGIAAWTVWGDPGLWALYNGLIAYIMMGLLMVSEYWVRRKVRKAIEDE